MPKDNDQAPPDKAARDAAADAKPAGDVETFPVDRLVSQATDFFGVTPAVAAGGLYGVNKKNLTIEEAEAAIKAWLDAPVQS